VFDAGFENPYPRQTSLFSRDFRIYKKEGSTYDQKITNVYWYITYIKVYYTTE